MMWMAAILSVNTATRHILAIPLCILIWSKSMPRDLMVKCAHPLQVVVAEVDPVRM
jgi:hypothetical protein